MPRMSAAAVPDLPDLIRRTSQLRLKLIALMKRFPEDHLDLGERIFVRLLNPVWRNQVGGMHGPYERKQTEVIAWIERYYSYLRDLELYVTSVLLKPEWFLALPLNQNLRPPAEECVRRLGFQEAALKEILDRQRSPVGGQDRGDLDLRVRLKAAIALYGLKDCSAVTGLSRDTINDLLSRRVLRPHQKTVKKLDEYLENRRAGPNGSPFPK